MSTLKQAVKLVQEGDRYSGHGRFFSDFIDDWSYHQTGLYPPSKPLDGEKKRIAHQLSHVIQQAWREAPGEDFLGHLIEECGGSGHLSFFRTPPSLSLLMAQLMGVKSGMTDFCDVCMGSGSLTLAHIYQTFQEGGAKAVARLNIIGEDLSANKVKVAMIQIINLLDILGDEQPLYVHSLRLYEINSLSRELGAVHYELSGLNNKRCRLSDEQLMLVHQALTHRIPIETISERIRAPINLIKREQQKLEKTVCLPQIENSTIHALSSPS